MQAKLVLQTFNSSETVAEARATVRRLKLDVAIANSNNAVVLNVASLSRDQTVALHLACIGFKSLTAVTLQRDER